MPRGRKKYTLDEKKDLIINEILKTEQELKDLKAMKKDLENQIKNQKLTELHNLIEDSGISIDKVKSMIENQ